MKAYHIPLVCLNLHTACFETVHIQFTINAKQTKSHSTASRVLILEDSFKEASGLISMFLHPGYFFKVTWQIQRI